MNFFFFLLRIFITQFGDDLGFSCQNTRKYLQPKYLYFIQSNLHETNTHGSFKKGRLGQVVVL